MKYPTRTQYVLLEKIRSMAFRRLFFFLVAGYLILNILFSLICWNRNIIKSNGFFDNLYFSFVTSTTLGYGDYTPISQEGKVFVVCYIMLITVYFAFMISILFLKLIYPRNTIFFSEKLCFHKNKHRFCFRIINTNTSKLINPDIRIVFIPHHIGDEIAPHYLARKYDDLCWLGKHDLTIWFNNKILLSDGTKIIISEELERALKYNNSRQSISTDMSRFRIKVSITGSYGFQQYIHFTKYSAEDIIEGQGFKKISYNYDYEKKHGIINYNKIPCFWETFNNIEP